MTVIVNKNTFNLREKLKELDYAHVPYDKMPGGSVIQASEYKITNEASFAATDFQTAYTHEFKPKRSNSKLIHHFWSKTMMENNTVSAGQDYRVIAGPSTSSDSEKDTIIRASWQNYWNIVDFSSDYYPPCDFIMVHEPNTTDIYHYKFQGRIYGGNAGDWTIGRTNMGGGDYSYGNRGFWIIYEVAQ